ncbi:hypothetical protein PLANPX_5788 [Lacipirellula parvula]|uniref:Uncharacterized protein n=1 Tax=Lacipirellula parvula TaxID=2650471 RepID=A0A5K7XMR5_9BACT|nr:hypothetical protein PLANPX_5788 [Lacipirellula parvula]
MGIACVLHSSFGLRHSLIGLAEHSLPPYSPNHLPSQSLGSRFASRIFRIKSTVVSKRADSVSWVDLVAARGCAS